MPGGVSPLRFGRRRDCVGMNSCERGWVEGEMGSITLRGRVRSLERKDETFQ
jgi:hypothetical protein